MATTARRPLRAIDWRTVRIYALIVVATLVGTELLARIYGWTPPARDFAAGDKLGLSRYNYAPDGFGDLVPRQDGHWVTWFHRPYHVQTNSVGLRNTEEPIAGAYRILAIGDSQTFGPFLANEDTWPAWTESYLRQRDHSAERTQVFNAGIVGYTIVDELGYLRDKALAFKPRLVILAVFENDLRDLLKVRDGAKKRPGGSSAFSRVANAFRTMGRNLALVSLANDIKGRIELASAGVDIRQGGIHGATGWAPPSPEDEALAKRYTAHFLDMAKLLKEQAVDLAVLFIPAATSLGPDHPSIMEPVIRAATATASTPYLDLTAILQTQPDALQRLYLLQRGPKGELTGDGHLSREGNAVVGRALADWLVARGLVR
jgi:lysophospholipase L1-like esterase